MKLKGIAPWKKTYDEPRQCIKGSVMTLLTKVWIVKAIVLFIYLFSSSHVWVWELDHKECWAPKNCCFWTVFLWKTLESPLDSKEIKRINSKGNELWIFIGRTNAEALIFWPPDVKSWLTGKDPNAGKDWGQEEKRATENEIVGWQDGITASMDTSLSKLQEIWRTNKSGLLQRIRHNLAVEWNQQPE